MEAILGISLYSYLNPKLAKMICFSYYLLCFLFDKIREEGGTGSAWNRVEVAQTVFTHVSKCSNIKIKRRKEKNIK
jgi:hypothetical protein